MSLRHKSPHDFLDTIIQVQEACPNALIVGGQCVNFWALIYQNSAPDLSRFAPFTSRDLDLIGDRSVHSLLTKLHPEYESVFYKLPGSPSVGVLIQPQTKEIVMDVLTSLYGINNRDIELHSVEKIYNGQSVRLLSPISCLKAKVANFLHLPQLLEDGSIRQDEKHVRTLALIVPQFLQDQIQKAERCKDTKELRFYVESLIEFCRSHDARLSKDRLGLSWDSLFPLKSFMASKEPKIQSIATQRLARALP